MLRRIVLLALTLIVCQRWTSAQTASCSDFSIVAVNQDTFNTSQYMVSIQFNGTINQLIGYPYISAMLDGNGDTIATGSMFYFGQLGGTVQEYPVLPGTNFNTSAFTAVFIFLNDTATDTCLLSFPSTSGITEPLNPDKGVTVFPNPTAGEILIRAEAGSVGREFKLIDGSGKNVRCGRTAASPVSVDLTSSPSGVYFLLIDQEQRLKVIRF